MDLGFLIDAFTTGGDLKFNQLVTFVIAMVEKFDISQHDTRVAVIRFVSFSAIVEFKFDSYVDKKSTIEKIRGIKYGGNSNPTKLSYALSMAQYNVYSKDSIRDGIPRILIVLNGGKSSVDDQVKPYSQAIRDLGVTIYAVAIGKNYNADQLKEMATDKDHIFTTPTLSDLGAVAQPIKDKICQGLDVYNTVITT